LLAVTALIEPDWARTEERKTQTSKPTALLNDAGFFAKVQGSRSAAQVSGQDAQPVAAPSVTMDVHLPFDRSRQGMGRRLASAAASFPGG
jgi:hypothetical protein